MLGLDETGIYNVAYRFAVPVALIVNAVRKSWVPLKFEIHAKDGEEKATQMFSSLATYFVGAITYLWVGASLWGPEVMRLMVPEEFHGAIVMIPFLAFIPLADGFYSILGSGYFFSENTKSLPLVAGFSMIVVVICSYLLVPVCGAIGAALSVIVAKLLATVCINRLAKSRLEIPFEWKVIFSF
jgi:O-antigen/teichoic acid export membrane protein